MYSHISLSLIEQLYDKWNIHIFVLLSFLLQAILTMFAPLRKGARTAIVPSLLWTAYVLADWAAVFAIGLISNTQREATQKGFRHPNAHDDILAFWAPFMLLHLGGPDTITAFSIEDNAIWRRHFFGFITQVLATIIVFRQSFLRNGLRLSAVLMLIAGTIKYGERALAFYAASLDNFRRSMRPTSHPGPNYFKHMAVYDNYKEAKLPTRIELVQVPKRVRRIPISFVGQLTDCSIVTYAYFFFNDFKGLIVDRKFSLREREESMHFFQQTSPEDAFDVLAVELNFMYDVLYTKAPVVLSWFGQIIRFIFWCVVVAALSIFFSLDKCDFHKIDIGITYSLLFGALCLDAIALFKLAFSDWSTVCIETSRVGAMVTWMHECFLPLQKVKWPEESEGLRKRPKESDGLRRWEMQHLFRRWSGSLYAFNLIALSVKEIPKMNFAHMVFLSVISHLRLKRLYYSITHVKDIRLKKTLWKFIFDELKDKSHIISDLETATNIHSARGDFAILLNVSDAEIRKCLMHYITDLQYDESLAVWHIATELCYIKDTKEVPCREHCKNLSDYMFYLLIMQPTMMSAVAGIGEIAREDKYADTIRFVGKGNKISKEDFVDRILSVNSMEKPIDLEGPESKSMLFDANILAKNLLKLKEEKWRVISKVWVELLSYAASHSKPHNHVAQLSKGGGLITFVWLLMAHLGIGEEFEAINVGQGDASHKRSKLVVGK